MALYSGLLLSTLNSSWRRFLVIKKKKKGRKIIDTWNQWFECKVRMAFLIYTLISCRNDQSWKLSILSALSIEGITEIVLSLSHLLICMCYLAEVVLKTFICVLLYGKCQKTRIVDLPGPRPSPVPVGRGVPWSPRALSKQHSPF